MQNLRHLQSYGLDGSNKDIHGVLTICDPKRIFFGLLEVLHLFSLQGSCLAVLIYPLLKLFQFRHNIFIFKFRLGQGNVKHLLLHMIT